MAWRVLLLLVAALFSLSVESLGQDRAAQVRRDRQRLGDSSIWVYNDLNRGVEEARRTGKPLFVVIRCIPCEACSQFDKQLLEEDNEVRDLFDRFVCVRIVQANGLDLSLFQFDYDQSFHALFLNADRTIYGRYGTRSARPEEQDMTLAGLREAMLEALALHEEYPANRDLLAGKQGHPVSVRVPEQLPALEGKYGPKLEYDGNVVQSCIHCHQIRDAQRLAFRQKGQPIPDDVLFPYPLPDVLGLTMDPDHRATIQHVADGSLGDRAGLKPQDMIRSLDGQPLLSTADMQWVLHHAPDSGQLAAEIKRNGQVIEATISLEPGWRRQCDISFRPTTWELRRMATGGLVLEDLSDQQRRDRNLPLDCLALRVKHVGQYGDHAAAKRAGFQQEDLVLQLDTDNRRMTEGQFIARALEYAPGSRVPMSVLRGKQTLRLELPMQ